MTVSKIKFSPVDIEARKKLSFKAGDTVRVSSKILDEKGKFRLQAFEGMVLARKHGTEAGATFTVRKIASGIGVERIFPLYSPMIDKVEIIRKARARRSKLYYIRTKTKKDVRRKMRAVTLTNETNASNTTNAKVVIEKEVPAEKLEE